jgi:PAS domain S-box-containing protein
MSLRRQSLSTIAWRELGRNAGPPSVCYPVFVLVCAFASDYWTYHPTLVLWFAAGLTGAAAVRAWSGYMLTRQPSYSLQVTLSVSTLLCAALWTAYTCIAIAWFKFGWTSQLMVIMSLGLSAGGTATLGPSLPLLRAFVAIQLLPPGAVILAQESRESLTAAVLIFYAVFLFSLGRRQNTFYWKALEDNELLLLRSLELEHAKQETEQLSERNQSILHSAGDGIVGVDPAGRATFVNPAVARMSGRGAETLLGHPVTDWLTYEGEGSDVASCIADVCARGVEHRCSGAAVVRHDGTRLVVDFVATPIRSEGRVAGAVVSLADVTQRYELEQLKDHFVSTVSHELRTPLTSIRGSLGMLASGQLDANPQAARRMLEIANTNTERLVRLINDLLDLQKIQQVGLALQCKGHNLADLMRAARESMEGLAEKQGVLIEAEPIEVKIEVDADRMVQAVSNLLSNAIKFSERGQTVRLSAQASDGEVELCVADQGIGIPPEEHERIFEDFFQVDGSDSRSRGGTGLGLAICRRIVDAHGGRVWVDSAPGRGSRFYITLPKTCRDPMKSVKVKV